MTGMTHLAVAATLCAATLTTAAFASTAPLSVPTFRTIDARNGAHVHVRFGEKQSVTVTRGNTTTSAVRVVDDGRLLIDRAPGDAPSGYHLEVEVVTPRIDALSVSDGGLLACEGEFPGQAQLAAAVSSGGLLDARALRADAVSAAVESGGRIFTTPIESLAAAIQQGGAITYWGHPQVQRAVQQGGVVIRGREADRHRPAEELGETAAQ